ncbi:MAG: ABC transporter permease [Oscillospiraceae bacterium]|nr:ABC transporter permease [Oscillospiraceae bacterium]
MRPNNMKNIVDSMTVVSFLTIGAGCLMISGYIDLSVGAVGTLCGILMAKLLVLGVWWPIACLLTIAAGAICGIISAILVNELRFQAFIATMAMASITQGFMYIISSGQAVIINDAAVGKIGSGVIFGYLPVTLVLAVAAFIIYGVLMSGTKFGRDVYLVGGNPEAARLAGIYPKKISYILFFNSGALGGLAGMLFAARVKSATVTGIINSQFSGMTAAILGGVSFGGGAGGLGGAFVGLLILNAFNNGMMILGISPYWQTFASGIILIAALMLDYARASRRARSKLA